MLATFLRADGPADNLPDKVRRVPPPGIKIPDADRAQLMTDVAALGKEIDDLRAALAAKPELIDLLPDVQVFHKAVHDALKYDEIYDIKEIAAARRQLQLGLERARSLREGKGPWLQASGLVVRGYKSKIDESIQPYGLVVPKSFAEEPTKKRRLDFWAHGRGEKLTELAFVQQRLTNPGEFTPPDAFVLHLYGRYCCANKFAGEVDLFEAYASARQRYPIDENRLVMRGFSMGGAAAWQFAVHYPSFFCAAAPGAGFSETPEFLKVFQNEVVKPTWYEQKLWGWYDCPPYAVNLFNLPTVAYSGEIDRQKQAADVMARAFEREGMKLTHLVGPKTDHKYHPETKAELNKLIDALAEKGLDTMPKKIRFATMTLRYNRSHWLQIDRVGEHWSPARVEAERDDAVGVVVTTSNVTAMSMVCPFRGKKVVIDSQSLDMPEVLMNGVRYVHLAKRDGKWTLDAAFEAELLRKRHGLQGPIDDAFMDRFIMVAPTGTPLNDVVGKWADAEMKHAIEHWRRQFRGEAIVKKDTDITDADIASSNLILWGDPSSNTLVAKVIAQLPIQWSKDGVVAGQSFDAKNHVPAMIYPNPLNPKKYVVLNSGFTFREYDYLNNARQVAKLPDWAIIDVSQPVTSKAPGAIAAAGFFDEAWKLK